MTKLLITGAEGQLGQSFVAALDEHQDFTTSAYGRAELDITDPGAIEAAVTRDRPDFVINTAAYTLVDRAEAEEDKAFQINQLGPAHLARICADQGIPLIHFSTDYLFDGSGQRAWKETDAPAPLNIYGASKLAGEHEIQRVCDQYLIFRISGLFSPFGSNFVISMLRLGAERSTLTVVNDQIGKPTCSFEVVRLVLDILPRISERWGVYHLAQPEAISWYGFAREVFAEATRQGFELALVELSSIESAEYPAVAVRPKNSNLDCKKFEVTFNTRIEPWQQSLNRTLREIRSND